MNSHKTAIGRTKPSAPARWLKEKGLIKGRALDFGCGRGKDAEVYKLDRYDPFYFPRIIKGKYDTILCTYVLNTLDKKSMDMVIDTIRRRLEPSGTAYITVRRDIKKEGVTSKNTLQRNIVLKFPVKYENSAFCIYEVTRGKGG